MKNLQLIRLLIKTLRNMNEGVLITKNDIEIGFIGIGIPENETVHLIEKAYIQKLSKLDQEQAVIAVSNLYRHFV